MGVAKKEGIHKAEGFNKKIEKMLEGAVMKAHIYDRYFEHDFERKDVYS